MGPVSALTFATYQTALKEYCQVDGTTYDTILEALFNAAKAKADTFLNNPFEVVNPTIVLSGVSADDWVTINGQTYTAATTGDEENLEFAVGSTDSDTADNLCALINSTTEGGSYGIVGVPGVTATNVAGTITLTREFPYPDRRKIEVESADEDTMMVRQVRTTGSIPYEVYQWIYQYVYRHFRNPGAVMQESIAGDGTKMWVGMRAEGAGMADNYDLIQQYRIPVGF
jgi:hypothetical protein